MRYWRWWVTAFVCLTLLCCLASCLYTRLTADIDGLRQDALRNHEMAEAFLVGLFIGATIENWLKGVLVMLGLTILLVTFTVVLERKQRYEAEKRIDSSQD